MKNEFKKIDDSNNESKSKYRDVFKKYFGKDSEGRAKGIYAKLLVNHTMIYDDSLFETVSPIFKKDILKNFMRQLYDAYKKYKNDYIFKEISKKIPDLDNVLIYSEYSKFNEKSENQILSKYLTTSINDFNPSISDGLYASESFLATKKDELSNFKGIKTTPSLVLIAYNNNGQPIISGDYKFDSEPLLKFNVKLSVTPRRDYDHIYVDGHIGPILNQAHVIHVLTNVDGRTLYFDKFIQLKTYMLKYIRDNSTKV